MSVIRDRDKVCDFCNEEKETSRELFVCWGGCAAVNIIICGDCAETTTAKKIFEVGDKQEKE